ncbi:MAG TPA: hypothetical protein PLH09_10665, partial [Lentimicrobium sp.]|nr:hypothetical protein [Lentimicrobium sp.]
MKLAIKLAYRNLIGAGLRTWLNVIVLSFSFVVIIWLKGVMTGWDHQAKTDMTNWEIGGGQYWHEAYDPYDPFTLSESHAPVPGEFLAAVAAGEMEPVLITQANIFPEGRMMQVMLRGINPDQSIFQLPTRLLDSATDATPAIIGAMMAKTSHLSAGDYVTLRWRDANGTFDATDILICGIFNASVPAIDAGQVYIALDKLQEMLLLPGE